jgi:hypothetical protein
MNQLPVLIVTGGARGIGAATAKLAAARGYAVCINYQHGRGAAEQLARDITSRRGQAIAVQADISSEPSGISSAPIPTRTTLLPTLCLSAARRGRVRLIAARSGRRSWTRRRMPLQQDPTRAVRIKAPLPASCLRQFGSERGPSGGQILSKTTFIPAAEYSWEIGACGRLLDVGGCRQPGARAVHCRLLVLQTAIKEVLHLRIW